MTAARFSAFDGSRGYHAGDTAAFAGLAVIGQLHRPDVALLPVGDHHTSRPEEAAVATRLLVVRWVVSTHHGIRAEIGRVREALDRRSLTGVEVLPMRPGRTRTWNPAGEECQ